MQSVIEAIWHPVDPYRAASLLVCLSDPPAPRTVHVDIEGGTWHSLMPQHMLTHRLCPGHHEVRNRLLTLLQVGNIGN
eukprot:6245486-Amphidinium_carterae.2